MSRTCTGTAADVMAAILANKASDFPHQWEPHPLATSREFRCPACYATASIERTRGGMKSDTNEYADMPCHSTDQSLHALAKTIRTSDDRVPTRVQENVQMQLLEARNAVVAMVDFTRATIYARMTVTAVCSHCGGWKYLKQECSCEDARQRRAARQRMAP